MAKGDGHRVTQRDVARRVGVSSAAVSYALNDGPGVSEEMRDRIRKVAEEMGFRPSRLARGLRLGRTNTIGLLVPDLANPFYPELASGVIQAASKADLHVFVLQVGLDGKKTADAVSALIDSHCEGILFTAVLPREIPLVEDMRRRGVPFGFIHRRVPDYEADWVGIDDFTASFELTLRLLGNRHRVAVLGGPHTSTVSEARLRGALEAARRTEIEVLPDGHYGALTRESGAKRARALFKQSGVVDLVICGNDMIALGVLDACEEYGFAVPGQVAVAGFDDMSFASAGPLRLTTVRVPRQAMGRRAVSLLQDRIADHELEPREVVLPYDVLLRGTA